MRRAPLPARCYRWPDGFECSRLGQLLQHGAETNAALAGERGGFRDRSLIRVGPGKADSDLVATEHRPLALARRVLVIDEFALPPAVRAGVGADVIEERIAAADPAIVQHHDAGVAAVDAVKHPDMDRIETVLDAIFSDRKCQRRGFFADRGHHRVEGNARQLRRAAFEKILLALLPALERERDLVGLEQGLEIRILVVAQRRYVDRYLATIGFLVGANERERRIAAHHLAVIDIEHAAARTVHRMHLDLVKSLQHCRSGPQFRTATYCLCRHATPGPCRRAGSVQPGTSNRSFDLNRMLCLPASAMPSASAASSV